MVVVVLFFITVLSLGGYLVIAPYYNVWRSEMQGKATLAEAEYSRQSAVCTAQAELDASKLEVQAIAVLGEAYKQHPEYRYMRFLDAFADGMRNGSIQKIVYVPTENNIPLIKNVD